MGIYHPKWAQGTASGIYGQKLNILDCAELSGSLHLCDDLDLSQHLCEKSSSSAIVIALTFNRKVLVQRLRVSTILEVESTNHELIRVDRG